MQVTRVVVSNPGNLRSSHSSKAFNLCQNLQFVFMLEELPDVGDYTARENRGEKALRLVPLDFLEFTVLRAAGLLGGQENFFQIPCGVDASLAAEARQEWNHLLGQRHCEMSATLRAITLRPKSTCSSRSASPEIFGHAGDSSTDPKNDGCSTSSAPALDDCHMGRTA